MKVPNKTETRFWSGMVEWLLFPALVLMCNTAHAQKGNESQASFGDVVERQMPVRDYVVQTHVVMDLDRGELLSIPTNTWMAGINNPRPRYNWMVKHGADLLVYTRGSVSNFTFHLDDGRVVLCTNSASAFETIAAPNVSREIEQGGTFQHLEIPTTGKGANPTLLFKTREGGLGVMQILGFSAGAEPVLKLRYKLVQQARPMIR